MRRARCSWVFRLRSEEETAAEEPTRGPTVPDRYPDPDSANVVVAVEFAATAAQFTAGTPSELLAK